MKNMLKTTAVAAAGLMVLMLALTTDGARVAAQGMKPLLVQVMNTAAEPVPVVSPVDRVLLQYPALASDACPDFAHAVRRVLPDGTRVESFTVPPGKRLVLTDLEGIVRMRFNLPWTVGHVAEVDAFVPNANEDVIRAYGHLNADAVAAGMVPVSVHLQTGGVIGPNIPVCLSEAILSPSGFLAAELREARLQGYLIDE